MMGTTPQAVVARKRKEHSMRHSSFVLPLLAVSAVIGGGLQLSRVAAQEATPTGFQTLVLVERNEHQTTLDLGEKGSSVGDMIVWGPNPLYDESNTTVTGAVTAGTCVAFTADFACILVETITFPDGSTLQFQGEPPGAAAPYQRTIVGGAGIYLGATGTAEAAPSADGSEWTRTIEVQAP